MNLKNTTSGRKYYFYEEQMNATIYLLNSKITITDKGSTDKFSIYSCYFSGNADIENWKKFCLKYNTTSMISRRSHRCGTCQE